MAASPRSASSSARSEVGVGGDAQDRLERSGELGLVHLKGIGRYQAELGAALGGADGVVGLDDIEALWGQTTAPRAQRET